MKNIMIAALVVLAGFACKKEKENAPPPPTLTPEELLTKGRMEGSSFTVFSN